MRFDPHQQPIRVELEKVRAMRIAERWPSILALASRLHTSKTNICAWLKILRTEPQRFAPDGTLIRRRRADLGRSRKFSLKDVDKVKALLKDPDRTQKSIAEELDVPRGFVSLVRHGYYD